MNTEGEGFLNKRIREILMKLLGFISFLFGVFVMFYLLMMIGELISNI